MALWLAAGSGLLPRHFSLLLVLAKLGSGNWTALEGPPGVSIWKLGMRMGQSTNTSAVGRSSETLTA